MRNGSSYVCSVLHLLAHRYYKGSEVWGQKWFEVHAELMVVTTEAVLPLAITAIAATNGSHDSEHAKYVWYCASTSLPAIA